jgi:hypothetical protein
MEQKKQQLVNLVTLFDALLSPAIDRLIRLDEKDDLLLFEHATASIVEAFGWYRIGVASGFVPHRESEVLLSTYFQFAANKGVRKWRGLFSHEFLEWLDSALHLRRFFNNDEWIFEDGVTGWAFLQTAATLAGDFASDGAAQSFVVAVNFLSEAEWVNLLASALSIDALIEHFVSDTTAITLSKDVCFVGFFNTLSHFGATKRLAGHLQGDPAISAPDRGTLRRSIQQVQTWRLNSRRLMVRTRVNEFATYAGRLMMRDIRIRDLGFLDEHTTLGNFIQTVDDLISHWNNFGTESIQAKA